MDLSEHELVHQTKLADRQIELLQKQITLMEKRQRVWELQQKEAIPVPRPNNSEKNFDAQELGEGNAVLREMHAQLDEAMKPFPPAPKQAEPVREEDRGIEPSPAVQEEVRAPKHAEEMFEVEEGDDDQVLSDNAEGAVA